MQTQLYSKLAGLVAARQNCEEANNVEWFDRHSETIDSLVKDHMPSGSGFDEGTGIDLDSSTPDRLVFRAGFHHMNDDGCYDGWTYHTVIVTPSLVFGFNLRITGKDRNDIKKHISEVFSLALSQGYLERSESNAIRQ